MSADPTHLDSILEDDERNNEYQISSSPVRGHTPRRPSQHSNATTFISRSRQGCYSHSSWGIDNPSTFDISSQPRSVSVPTEVTSLYSPRNFEPPGTLAAWQARDYAQESSDDDDEDAHSVLSRPSGEDASRRRLSNQLYAVGSHIPNPQLNCRQAGPWTDQNAPYPERIDADEDDDGFSVLEHAPSEVPTGTDHQANDDQRGDGSLNLAAHDGQRDPQPAGNEGRAELWENSRPGTSSTSEESISITARAPPVERGDATANETSANGFPTSETSKPALMTLSYRAGHQQVAAGDGPVRDRSEKTRKTSEALQKEGGSKPAEPAKGDGKPKNGNQHARRGRNK